MAKNRNLFRISRFILLKVPGLFRLFFKYRKPKKRLLIIKADAIGDYILFRNFIEITAKSEIYRDYEIDLLANSLWKDLFLKYDAGFISKSFFTNPEKLYDSPWQLLKLGLQLAKRNYELVLQPTHAHTFIVDGLAGLASAKQVVGFASDTERIALKYKTKTDRFYTRLIDLPLNITFEFEKNRFFFQSVLNESVTIKGPSIEIEAEPKKGIVVFPGSGVFKRSWEKEKFLELIKRILNYTPHPVYIAGGPGEIEIGNYLTANLPADRITDVTAKTSLPQLVQLIGNAALIIANETSAIHIAAATKTKAICVLGGGHFERFAPYPDVYENKPVCLFEKMECYNCNWNCKFITSDDERYPCIANVTIDPVWEAVKSLI